MKNIYIILTILIILLNSCERKFAEFEITDVSKDYYFVDSISAHTGIQHNNVSVFITGEIDSSAAIRYASYP